MVEKEIKSILESEKTKKANDVIFCAKVATPNVSPNEALVTFVMRGDVTSLKSALDEKGGVPNSINLMEYIKKQKEQDDVAIEDMLLITPLAIDGDILIKNNCLQNLEEVLIAFNKIGNSFENLEECIRVLEVLLENMKKLLP